MKFCRQPSQRGLKGWDESSNLPREPELQEKQQFIHCTDTFPDLPQLGMVGMVLLTEPHTAAESGSRQCSVPGAGTGVSKDGHPEGSGL